MRVAGLLLAAGAGRRMGGPKALVVLDGEPLVLRARRALGDAGLAPTIVVLGAAHEQVAAVLGDDHATRVVVAHDWDEGMGASLRAGLAAAATVEDLDAVLVALVDTPGVGPAALRRVAEHGARRGRSALARGAVGGVGSHPVLLGRAHWDAVATSARGDAGARDHLRGHPDLALVEIGDVADPADVDTPGDLQDLTGRRHGH